MMQLHTLLGLTISLFFTEWFGLYPGGLIVPIYLSLYVEQPLRIVGTLCIAILSLLIYRFLNLFLILYGRRRFILLLFTGSSLTFIWSLFFTRFLPEGILLQSIGWMIPGLIANSIEKQGFFKTIVAMSIVTLTTYTAIQVVTFLFF